MEITIKNLKVAKFASHETLCFDCTVYADGVKVGTASNHGTGGPNNYHGDFGAMEAYAKTLPNIPWDMDDEGYAVDVDHLLDDAIAKFEMAKQMKRWCAKEIVFRLPGDTKGNFRTFKLPKGRKYNSVTDKPFVLGKYPDATIMNETLL